MKLVYLIIVVGLFLCVLPFFCPVIVKTPTWCSLGGVEGVIHLSVADRNSQSLLKGKPYYWVCREKSIVKALSDSISLNQGEGDMATVESVIHLSTMKENVGIVLDSTRIGFQTRENGWVEFSKESGIHSLLEHFRPFYLPIVFIR